MLVVVGAGADVMCARERRVYPRTRDDPGEEPLASSEMLMRQIEACLCQVLVLGRVGLLGRLPGRHMVVGGFRE